MRTNLRSRGAPCAGLVLTIALLLATCGSALAAKDPSVIDDGTPGAATPSSVPRGYDSAHIWVKFQDDLDVSIDALRYPADRRGAVLQGGNTINLFETVRAAGGVWERGVGLDEERIDALRRTAEANLGRDVPDLNTYFVLTVPEGMSATDLMAQLRAVPEVENAGFQPLPMPAPLPGSFVGQQDYLDNATDGIGASYAWTFGGGTGSNVRICDIEYSWNLSHQDLPAVTTLVPGGKTASDPFADNNHGTAVLGEMGSLNNSFGTTGAAYGASFFVAPANFTDGYQPALALTNALGTLTAGDVIIIEQQIAGPNWPGGTTQFGLVPLEWLKPVYDAIVVAVGAGVNVVAAAGNGSQDLDDAVYGMGNGGHHPFLAGNNSGAIIVGAGAAPSGFGSTTDRSRLGFSCYGSRVNLQGWGEGVTTTGYGGLYSGDGVNLYYTSGFSGTSSATPIVTSAVADYESIWEATHGGATATPAAIRAALIATGSPQQAGTNPVSQHIGPRPNLNVALCFAGDHLAPVVTCPTNVTVECTATGGTPRGDPLLAAFFAGASATDNCDGSPVITNNAPPLLPDGFTTVTFTATDASLNASTCTATVHVVDTTAPTIACPAAIQVECNDHCLGGGVPDTDPAIVAFLAGASAIDICDATPTITDDHPACFQLGDNPVTFTATDDATNQTSCVARVRVVDTTPPVITVSVDRTSLWPPNHKLATINATVTVTDVCDPSPTFVLTSIVSNEPENGLGDGDTAPDVAGAGYGTDDVQFQLRSERGGTGSGRKYTITYTASDESGNTATATACVFVPHDNPGGALASQGFDLEGDGLQGDAEEFALVVPTLPADDGGDLVGGGVGVDRNPLMRAPILDATDIDALHAYVGNSAGAVAALRSELGDVDLDGYDDAVFHYPVAAVEALVAISTPEDGPIGLHFELDPLHSYLVPDIFALGAPVALPADLTAWHGDPGSARAGGSGEAAAREPQAAPTPQNAPAPVVQQALPRLTRFTGVYPNPFAASATVAFDLAQGDQVRLAVYDLRGALVQTLRSAWLPAGRYQVAWDGRDRAGHIVPGGVYLIRFNASGKVTTRKAVLMK